MSENKACTKCAEIKPLAAFYSRRGGRDGRASECQACRNAKIAAYQKTHPDIYRAIRQRWRSKNNPVYVAGYQRGNWKRKGIRITPTQYAEMFAKQFGQCWICEVHQDDLPKRLAVDHDHASGEIRGLLCYTCNSVVVLTVEKYGHLISKTRSYLYGKHSNTRSEFGDSGVLRLQPPDAIKRD